MTPTETSIVKLDPENHEHVSAASHLHATLLPESVLSKLGYFFLSRFYYACLPRHGLIGTYLYRRDGQYIGFITCTLYPFTFMSVGMRKALARLLYVLAVTVIQKPSRLAIFAGMGSGLDLETLKQDHGENVGQFMSFGVVPAFRGVTDSATGLSPANALMEQVFRYFDGAGRKCFFLLVQKTNQAAIRFYLRHKAYHIPGGSAESDVYVFDIPV